MDLQTQKAVDARWDLACERVMASRVSVFIRERSQWRETVSLPMPATNATIRALVKSAVIRAKSLFTLERLYVWDRTPERILIGVAARVYAETSGARVETEFKRWISDFSAFEKGLS
jgi:uncharacterized protein (DUF1697 family)